ncbi:uncharacterized protein LOC109805146 [Cajanus cajan]|uniref:uncharacterized protein LOC109805146 n=1 Tax=Cajanus cajan TaxID=3821 RepID=UPI00098DA747|nr:uncharacterized protein LOC109805146 [Cajanus cajan]
MDYYAFDAIDLCLVPDVVIPPKFKVPEFDKYNENSCPRNHLTMYCKKMAACAHNDKLLIHFFQESLIGPALGWYMNLEQGRIRTWKDLAEAFIKKYKYNMDMAPDRTQLQNMVKKDNETFKEYAQRWRGIAAQVQPPLSEKEMVAMFIDTLQSPFYDRMIGNVSSNFSDLVVIGERVEVGIRSGKIAQVSTETITRKPVTNMDKKKGGETNAVMPNYNPAMIQTPFPTTFNPTPIVSNYRPQFMYNPQIASFSHPPYQPPHQPKIAYNPPIPQTPTMPTHQTNPSQIPQHNMSNSQKRNNQERNLVPIPMTYTELLQHLVRNSLVTSKPLKPIQPPYPKSFDPKAKCDYHAGVVGHFTEKGWALKYKVQDLIDEGLLSFKEENMNVSTNPLPGHGNSSVNSLENEPYQLVKEVVRVKTPMKIVFDQLCEFKVIDGEVHKAEAIRLGLKEDY